MAPTAFRQGPYATTSALLLLLYFFFFSFLLRQVLLLLLFFFSSSFFAGDRADPAHIPCRGRRQRGNVLATAGGSGRCLGYSARGLRSIQHILVARRDDFLRARDAFFST